MCPRLSESGPRHGRAPGCRESVVKDVYAERLGDTGRLALSINFDLDLAEEVKCASPFSGLQDGSASANPAVNRDRSIEAYLVTAEVYRTGEIIDLDEVTRQRRYQREREITVGDGLAIGQLLFRPFGIDVNPLEITGRLGEPVDFLLVDIDPVGQAYFLAFQRFRIFN